MNLKNQEVSDEEVAVTTGLPPGPLHDAVIAAGRDYIVVHVDGNSGPWPVCMLDPGRIALSAMLGDTPWTEWVRIRAESMDAALARCTVAHDQWTAIQNGSPQWRSLPLHDGDAYASIMYNRDFNKSDKK